MLRLKLNDALHLTNGKGLLCRAVLSSADKKQSIVTIQSVQFFEETKPNTTIKKAAKPTPKIEDLKCPKCKTNALMTGKSAVGCSDFKNCGFKIPFVLMSKKLTKNQLVDMMSKGKTGLIKGLTNPTSQDKFSGKFYLDAAFNVQFEEKK